jgi:hypothetical protein
MTWAARVRLCSTQAQEAANPQIVAVRRTARSLGPAVPGGRVSFGRLGTDVSCSQRGRRHHASDWMQAAPPVAGRQAPVGRARQWSDTARPLSRARVPASGNDVRYRSVRGSEAHRLSAVQGCPLTRGAMSGSRVLERAAGLPRWRPGSAVPGAGDRARRLSGYPAQVGRSLFDRPRRRATRETASPRQFVRVRQPSGARGGAPSTVVRRCPAQPAET